MTRRRSRLRYKTIVWFVAINGIGRHVDSKQVNTPFIWLADTAAAVVALTHPPWSGLACSKELIYSLVLLSPVKKNTSENGTKSCTALGFSNTFFRAHFS